MTDGSASGDDGIWAYVPPGAVRVPEPPVEEQLYVGLSALRTGLARLRAWVSGEAAPDEAQTSDGDRATEDDGARLEALRDRVAPPPDWSGAVAALDKALRGDSEGGETPTLVHEPAYHEAPSIVEAWGAGQDGAVLEPPPHSRLGEEDGAAWVDAQREPGRPWVLPRLERWWLRTPDGLAFVRSLLDAWAAGALGRGTIGVGRHAWRGGAPAGTVEERSDGGRVVLAPEEHRGPASSSESDAPSSTFLRSLAAFSDGDPGVAWALWRRSLRAPGAETSASSVADVPPWADLESPALPDDLDRPDLLLLHALVLHGGLSDGGLDRVTPLDRYDRRGRLRTFRRADLLVRDDETWRTTALGHPVVCRLLRNEGYLSRWGDE